MSARTHRLLRAARWLAMMAAGVLLWWIALWAIDMPPNLPGWRRTLAATGFATAVALWWNA